MKEIKDIRKVYFIGIGGIGMSALARYFKFHGRQVSGYDKTETPLTKQLVEEGIAVHYTDDVELAMKDADLIVYTPAVPAGHRELEYFRKNGSEVYKRSDVLGAITKSSFNICVAGTHGKTTITTMVAHLLRHSGYGCNAFLGGISVNYNINYWSNERNVCVVEADEYDRSFLKLSPDIAVITAMDADHLDIYGTAESLEEAFIAFSGKLKPGGLLISKAGLERDSELSGPRRIRYHASDPSADTYAENISLVQGGYHFDVVTRKGLLREVRLNMGGMHNVENAVAAIAVATDLNIDEKKIRDAVESFRGVKRRFEYLVKTQDLVFIDDYAHHPEELKALISGAKALFPEYRCTVIFQPHLFSRTRDFVDGFAESLDLADEVILLPIYPARELPIEGVTSKIILDLMKIKDKRIVMKEELTDWLKKFAEERTGKKILITAGAGDIDVFVQPAKLILES